MAIYLCGLSGRLLELPRSRVGFSCSLHAAFFTVAATVIVATTTTTTRESNLANQTADR